MPSRREQIRMTPGEQTAFVESQKSLQVATINPDGTPHLTTLWFAVVDGDIVFATFTKSQKIRNLERDPRIACLLEDGLEYEELRGVQLNGMAELHADPDSVEEYSVHLMRRNNPDVPEEHVNDAVRAMAAKRTAVVVKADAVVSWDHRKLAGQY